MKKELTLDKSDEKITDTISSSQTNNTDSNQGSFPLVIEAGKSSLNLNQWITENKAAFDQKLNKHGALLFRNFKIDTISKFEEISQLFDSNSLEYAFRSSPRFSVGKNVYTSTSYPKDFSINMHSEASYMPNGHPQFIIFCCINPATEQGETPIADNRMVLNYLTEETRAKFLDKGIKYIRNLNKNIGLSWQEVFQTDDREHVEAECNRTAMEFNWKSEDDLEITWVKKAIWEHPATQEMVWFNHASFFNKFTLAKDYFSSVKSEDQLPNNTFYGDGSEISESEIDEILIAYKKATTIFPWQKGDVLFLDNMLSSHGRNPYEGKRKIVTSLF